MIFPQASHVCPLSGNGNEDQPVNLINKQLSKLTSDLAIGSIDILTKHNKFVCGYCKVKHVWEILLSVLLFDCQQSPVLGTVIK